MSLECGWRGSLGWGGTARGGHRWGFFRGGTGTCAAVPLGLAEQKPKHLLGKALGGGAVILLPELSFPGLSGGSAPEEPKRTLLRARTRARCGFLTQGLEEALLKGGKRAPDSEDGTSRRSPLTPPAHAGRGGEVMLSEPL